MHWSSELSDPDSKTSAHISMIASKTSQRPSLTNPRTMGGSSMVDYGGSTSSNGGGDDDDDDEG